MAKQAKKKKNAKSKKSQVKNQQGIISSAAGVLIVTIIIVVIVIFAQKSTNKSLTPQQENIATLSAAIATPTSTPKPTPTPLPIPAHSGRSAQVPILYYHYIGDNPNPEDKARDSLSVTPTQFEEEIKYLIGAGYIPTTLDVLYNTLKGQGGMPPKPIILTFDDGYIDFYLNAYPILKRHNVKATVFIPTGLMDQGYYLSWAQIKEMHASGLIDFQAHSVNHSNMVALTDEQIRYQAIESKKVLESQLGKPVNFYAYPFGLSDERSWRVIKESGYLGAVGTWYSSTHSEGTLYDLARIRMGGSLPITDFAKKI